MNMIGSPFFPHLTATNHQVTSPATINYNCIAWAAGDTTHWWQPDVYWPIPAPPTACDIPSLIAAFRAIGFELCVDGSIEAGFEKVVLYGDSTFYLHAAKQLATGKWSSKLGDDVDIEHDTPENVAGGAYGNVVHFMKRPEPAGN